MFTQEQIARATRMVQAITGQTLKATVEATRQEGLSLSLRDGKVRIGADSLNALMRGILLSIKAQMEGQAALSFTQSRAFSSCGVMLDVSRGGVMRVPAVKQYMKTMAALGMNYFSLYTEDTYTVPEYPYFGYLRGRYTAQEMREMDDCAAMLDIEFVPCVQTLAHLEQFLQWQEHADMRDQPSVLLIDEDKVYDFIEAEIRALRSMVRAKRLHIGMDEAHGVGLGRYFEKHGAVDRFALLNRHLSRVEKICRKYDFEPMMWSDMFFRLGSKTNDYYDVTAVIPDAVIEDIPPVRQVYWDYYHTDEALIEHMLAQHARISPDTVYAGGIWTWSGFLPNQNWTEQTMLPALKACVHHKVGTVFATMWGDDGSETDHFLALGQLPIFSEYCWQGEQFSLAGAYALTPLITGLPLNAYRALANFYPATGDVRTGKALMYVDPLFPLLAGHSDSLPAARERAQEALKTLAPYADRPDIAYAMGLFRIVEQKSSLVECLRDRYLAGDKVYLEKTARETLPALYTLYQKQMELHRALWESHYKRFGWEVLNLRYSAVMGRLMDVKSELERYLKGELATIEELDQAPLPAARKGGTQSFSAYASPQYFL